MDCNCNQRSATSCRPQIQQPPCMNTNCGCGAPMPLPPLQPNQPLPPIQPRMGDGAGTLRPSGYQPPRTACTIETANKPIAMAYVPWQQWRQTYPMEQALSRGTIFPELDLPFVMGRCR